MKGYKVSKYIKALKKIYPKEQSYYKKVIDGKSTLLGKLEFFAVQGTIISCLCVVSHNKDYLSDTIRLISAGVATHLFVDILTYVVDMINTKVKVESLKPKAAKPFFAANLFKNKFIYNKIKTTPGKYQSIFQSLNSYQGINSAIMYLTLNSIFFYGLYKNLKHKLSEDYNIHGFVNFFVSAAFAQLVAMTFSFPLENLKTRIQVSTFKYSTIIEYYQDLFIKNKKLKLHQKIKKEYSGFFSHLGLYVLYEAFTFGIYESLIEYFKKHGIMSDRITPDISKNTKINISNNESKPEYNYNLDLSREQYDENISKYEANFLYSDIDQALSKHTINNLNLYSEEEFIPNNVYSIDTKVKKHHSKEKTHHSSNEIVKPNLKQILTASGISGIVSAIITNPIDVYQINKQVNPGFSLKEINMSNMFVGLKERVFFLFICNTLTFLFLENVGPKYFDIALEDE